MYRYCLEKNFTYQNDLLKGIEFENNECKISNNTITVFSGYGWDGCSPTYKILFLWIGTPDGERGLDGIPVGYYPSLIHDCLCQYKRKINIKKEIVDLIFYELLLEYGMKDWQAKMYYLAVKWFGPKNFKGDDIK